jgi:putative tricarboxylic transport membrane protein
MSEPSEAGDGGSVVGSRWPEFFVAALLMTVALIVIVDARRVGTGWDEFDGPRSGYFPFYIGCLLLAASSWIMLRQLLAWRRPDPVFAGSGQLASVWAITWPMALFVTGVQFLGIYLSAFVLIAFFMRRHGHYRWPLAGAVALGVPLFFFLVFERWFLVALPKGPVEALLGL